MALVANASAHRAQLASWPGPASADDLTKALLSAFSQATQQALQWIEIDLGNCQWLCRPTRFLYGYMAATCSCPCKCDVCFNCLWCSIKISSLSSFKRIAKWRCLWLTILICSYASACDESSPTVRYVYNVITKGTKSTQNLRHGWHGSCFMAAATEALPGAGDEPPPPEPEPSPPQPTVPKDWCSRFSWSLDLSMTTVIQKVNFTTTCCKEAFSSSSHHGAVNRCDPLIHELFFEPQGIDPLITLSISLCTTPTQQEAAAVRSPRPRSQPRGVVVFGDAPSYSILTLQPTVPEYLGLSVVFKISPGITIKFHVTCPIQ